MVKRDIEDSHIGLCQKKGVSVLSYSSLALGLLTGKIGPDRVFEGDDQRKNNPRFSQSNRQKVAALMAGTAPIAEAHGATLPQTVIAWTLQQPGITFSLCGARDPEQAIDNARAGQLRLSVDDISEMNALARTHLIDMDA